MSDSIFQYFSDLQDCSSKVEVRHEDSQLISFDKGADIAVDMILKAGASGKKVIFVGNGGSAAIASHQSVDLWKCAGIRAIAFNDSSLLTCVSNDYGYEHVFEKPIEMFADDSDVLIAISSSGKSQNILRAVDQAREKNCHAITLSGFLANNPLYSKGHLNFYVPSTSYGYVEILHLAICHYISDKIMSLNTLKKLTAGN